MPLEPGTRLGAYEILAPLASGPGRAEAYRASDTRQRRDVVITILPHQLTENAEAQGRLAREIHVIASLKHPNISMPFELVRDDPSIGFLVTEWIDGESLAGRLARGALPIQEALAVAIAVADALDKAHRQGVTHRGLTPSAVILTGGGAKLLDFGLTTPPADFTSGDASGSLATKTGVSGWAGVPASAAAYMAPEQLQGIADARTDIFAFGAILHEMVTGRKAFEGKTQALVIAAIQSVDPEPASNALPMVPAALDHLLQRCLSKDPRQRLQTAWDLLAQLQWIAGGASQVGIPVTAVANRRRQEKVLWAALAGAALVAVGLAAWAAVGYARGAPERDLARFVVTSVGAGAPVSVSVSPDGRWIIGSKGGALSRGVDVQLLNSVTAQTLIPDDAVYQPFWSPDSRFIGYFSLPDGKLKKAAVSGGPSQTICETPTPIGYGTWNRDGVVLFSGGGVIQRVLAVGGQPVAVTTLDRTQQETEHVAPYFLPDGRHYVFLAASSQANGSALYVGSLDSQQRSRLFASESRAVYAAPGYLLFNQGNTVFARPFDARRLTVTGEAIRVADNVPLLASAPGLSPSLARSAVFAVSQTGVLIFRTTRNSAGSSVTDEQRSLVWFDRKGEPSSPLGSPGPYVGVSLSPDEKRIAVHRHEGTGGDSWIFDMAQGRMQRLTFDASQDNSSPLWSPDGARLAFGSLRNNKWGLYVTRADGAGGEELVTESQEMKTPMSWSPDGNLLLYFVQAGAFDVWAVSVTGDKKPFPVLQSPAAELYPQISRDGKWLAYQSNETGRAEIYVRPFPEGPGKWQVSTDGGNLPRWRGDGKELFFSLAPNLMAVEIRVSGSSIQAGVPKVLFSIANPNFGQPHASYHRYDVTADGQRFVITQSASRATTSGLAASVAGAADGPGGSSGQAMPPAAITVVLNWPQMLKKN